MMRQINKEKYLKNRVVDKDASILGELERSIGKELYLVESNLQPVPNGIFSLEDTDKRGYGVNTNGVILEIPSPKGMAHGMSHYKINEIGQVTGLYLQPYEGDIFLRRFPEELYDLNDLEELVIIDCGLEEFNIDKEKFSALKYLVIIK